MWSKNPEIEVKTIFLFGQSGVGKSTVCACLTLFLCETEGFVPSVGSVDNPSGAALSRAWRQSLRSNRFPGITEPYTFAEVVAGFRELRGSGGVKLRFLEVAGEDVVKLDPIHPEHRERAERLNDWMDHADVFLLLASAQPSEDDRYILEGFLELLEGDRRPVCLVLTEWDKVDDSSVELTDFAKTHYGEAARHVVARGGGLMSFSVGRVSQDGKTILDLRFDDGTRQLMHWLVDELDS